MKGILVLLFTVLSFTVLAQSPVKAVILKNDGFITEILADGTEDQPLIVGVTPFYDNDNGTSNRTYFSKDYSYEMTFITIDGVRKVVKIVKMFDSTIMYSWTINKPASKTIQK